ncbi:uncharacterized protein LOC124924489 [Impatiens glandulifera]|uniref:uncharacterized protein LOC124924489 n=1 Tax=Impatiens glandulifera TaxID=253017 RepID=UPI001FB0847E|nr:uncharacterized protein LOC124924489 [Impatiens glandulifera]
MSMYYCYSSSPPPSSSDDDEVNELIDEAVNYIVHEYVPKNYPQKHIRNRSKGREYYEREREVDHKSLMRDYFGENLTYPDYMFRRRFRMCKNVFLRLVNAVEVHDEFFHQNKDSTGRLGVLALQKCMAVMHILAYDTCADSVDEYLRMRKRTTMISLQKFTKAVIDTFGRQYLRRPTRLDLEELLRKGERRGFPGSYNDINILHKSSAFDDVLEGRVPDSNFVVNVNNPSQTPKEKLFAKHQEAARKDVERAFGVLQARFAIIRKPSLAWNRDVISKIMMACIIMHNMIVEDERDTYDGYDNP